MRCSFSVEAKLSRIEAKFARFEGKQLDLFNLFRFEAKQQISEVKRKGNEAKQNERTERNEIENLCPCLRPCL